MRLDLLIEQRFREWIPWVTIDMRRRATASLPFDLTAVIESYRATHRSAYLLARKAGIPAQTIRRRAIDDPRIDEFERRRRIAAAVDHKLGERRRFDRERAALATSARMV